ncbi:MAG: hypothetical protein QGF00_05500 [Planctomycetota bacterium]|nr:hypothetical protein [Planctomycetota bacterium]
MKPSQTLDLALQFSSEISPAWLVVLLPVLLGSGWLLYYREINRLPRRRIAVLCLLRLTLLGLVLFCVFMPSLDVVRRLLFPGRILILVDNSESMTVSDSSMPPIDTLALARFLNPDQVKADDQRTGFHQSSLHLRQLLAQVRKFQREVTEHGEDSPLIKRAGSALLDHSTALFIRFSEGEAGLPLDSLSPEARKEYESLQHENNQLKEAIADLGTESPSAATSPDEVCDALGRLVAGYQKLQRAIDEDSLSKGGGSVTELSDEIISSKRLDLVNRAVTELIPEVRKWAPEQYIQVMDLMKGEAVTVGPGGIPRVIEPVRGRTDLRGRLHDIITESSAFPLTSVIVISDGLDMSDEPVSNVLKQYVKKRVPIFCAGVGHLEEPYDLAVAEVRAPPIGIKDQLFSVEVLVKAAVRSPTASKLLIRDGQQEIAAKDIEVKEGRQIVYVPVMPTAEGLKHYSVELQSVEQDAFKDRNNAGAFVLEVRREKIRVLLLDDRPRWQTRFVVNIMSRLPYVDANSIVRAVQEDGKLERGLFKGSWPSTREILDIYDLVMLGRFESAALNDSEWKQVESLVKESGKTLVLLAPGDAEAYPAFVKDLFPLKPSAVSVENRLTRKSLRDLRLTEAGAFHPLTRSFHSHLASAPFVDSSLRPGSLVLLHDEQSRRPIISCRPVGRGKVFMLHSDRLWKCLNRRHLQRHAAIFINLIDWAVRTNSSRTLLDQNTLKEGDSFQAWGSQSGKEISVLDDQGTVIARSKVVPNSQELYRSVFAPLPPGHFSVREEGINGEEPLYVLPDNEELVILEQRADYLRNLSRVSGGDYRPLSEMEVFIPGMNLKARTEMHRHLIQIWSSQLALLFLLLLLSIEWVLRKYWSLI